MTKIDKMEKMKFDNLQKNWWTITWMIVALLLILIGSFGLIHFSNPRINKLISAAGFLLQAGFFLRMCWYKNYVQWNKKGMNLKISSWIGTGISINFEEVKSINFLEESIEFTLFGGRRKKIVNLGHIVFEDRQKLYQILRKYIN